MSGSTRPSRGFPPTSVAPARPGSSTRRGQLIEHIRIAQEDILEFCVDTAYHAHEAMARRLLAKGRGPADPEGLDGERGGVRAFARANLKRLARDVEDLTATVPTGKGNQTYLRAILLAADHVAYHVGQLVAVRRALGIWPAESP